MQWRQKLNYEFLEDKVPFHRSCHKYFSRCRDRSPFGNGDLRGRELSAGYVDAHERWRGEGGGAGGIVWHAASNCFVLTWAVAAITVTEHAWIIGAKEMERCAPSPEACAVPGSFGDNA